MRGNRTGRVGDRADELDAPIPVQLNAQAEINRLLDGFEREAEVTEKLRGRGQPLVCDGEHDVVEPWRLVLIVEDSLLRHRSPSIWTRQGARPALAWHPFWPPAARESGQVRGSRAGDISESAEYPRRPA